MLLVVVDTAADVELGTVTSEGVENVETWELVLASEEVEDVDICELVLATEKKDDVETCELVLENDEEEEKTCGLALT